MVGLAYYVWWSMGTLVGPIYFCICLLFFGQSGMFHAELRGTAWLAGQLNKNLQVKEQLILWVL